MRNFCVGLSVFILCIVLKLHLSVCLFVFPSLSVSVFLCLPVCLAVPYVLLSMYISVPVCPSVCLKFPFPCLCFCLFSYLSVSVLNFRVCLFVGSCIFPYLPVYMFGWLKPPSVSLSLFVRLSRLCPTDSAMKDRALCA